MKENKNISNRLYVVYFGVLLFSFFVIFKMFKTQLTVDVKEDNIISAIHEVNIKASRGNIFADDVEKSALAISVPVYELRMDVLAPSDELFNEKIDSLALGLANLFKDKSRTELKQSLKDARASGNRYYLIQKNISFQQMQEVKNMPILRKGQFRGGRIILKRNKRKRPFSLLAERTVGYFNATDTIVGLEGAYKQYLKGVDGKQYMKNVGGGERIPVSDDYLVEPQNGMDIYTTIDINIQDVAERALLKQLQDQNAEHGCVVLMEVKTGKIKAIANLSKDKEGNYREIYNHAVGRATEPGSTFKLPSIMVALEDKKTTLDELFDTYDGTIKYYDRVMRDAHVGGDGVIPVSKGFALSSNVVVSQIINNAYGRNPEKFVEGLKKMGLGEKLGIEIVGEGQPYLKERSDATWSGVTLPWMSIGYETKFTPLQILTFYNAVANGGKMVKPQFVTEIRDGAKLVEKFETEVIKDKICSESTIKKAQQILELVVEDGTGKNLNNTQYKIAGKTGTTQLAYGKSGYGNDSEVRHQASFCGYFPADNPKYSCIVVVAAPTKSIYGNVVSGTVFKEIADRVYATDIEMARTKKHLAHDIMPISKSGVTDDLEEVFGKMGVKLNRSNGGSKWGATHAKQDKVVIDNLSTKGIPNVKGMGLRDALYLLENKGFKVEVKGSGVISEQLYKEEGGLKIIELTLT